MIANGRAKFLRLLPGLKAPALLTTAALPTIPHYAPRRKSGNGDLFQVDFSFRT